MARELAVILTAVVRSEASITSTVELTVTGEEVSSVIVKVVEAVSSTPSMLTADKLAAPTKIIVSSPTVTMILLPLVVVE